jgi:F0F1-type ATP synthase assembly protein I
MSETGKDERQRRNPPGMPQGASAGWSILSYMITGMTLYGGIGWLIGRWTGIGVLFPVGMLLGLGLAVVMIILRYGRQ